MRPYSLHSYWADEPFFTSKHNSDGLFAGFAKPCFLLQTTTIYNVRQMPKGICWREKRRTFSTLQNKAISKKAKGFHPYGWYLECTSFMRTDWVVVSGWILQKCIFTEWKIAALATKTYFFCFPFPFPFCTKQATPNSVVSLLLWTGKGVSKRQILRKVMGA